MAYTTIAKVRVNAGFTDSALVADSIVTEKITYADGMINGKIGSVYQLPLAVGGSASTPDLIAMLSLEIATVLLLMSQYTEQAQDTDKGWEKRLKVAQGILDDLSKLKSRLFDTSGNEFDRSTLKQPAFFPTRASSEASAENSTDPKFKMNKVF